MNVDFAVESGTTKSEPASAAHITSVQRARLGNVFGTVDDGSAIRENGQRMRLDVQPQQVVVAGYPPDALQSLFERGQRDPRVVGETELYRIAATEDCRVAAALAGKPRVLLAITHWTIAGLPQRLQIDLSNSIVPQIDHEQFAVDGFRAPREQLDGFARLDRCDHVDNRTKNAG